MRWRLPARICLRSAERTRWLKRASSNPPSLKLRCRRHTTDAFVFLYAGYGFRLKGRKGPALGIYQVLLDEVSLGNVDLYNAGDTGPVVLLTKLDVPLGLHRVKIKATNTKNALSTANTITADAVEILP